MWTEPAFPAVDAVFSRRQMLQRMATGFGMVGLAGLLGSSAASAAGVLSSPHLRSRARRVIFLFMNGGPSHVDTFDPKPALGRFHGQDPPARFAGSTRRGGRKL